MTRQSGILIANYTDSVAITRMTGTGNRVSRREDKTSGYQARASTGFCAPPWKAPIKINLRGPDLEPAPPEKHVAPRSVHYSKIHATGGYPRFGRSGGSARTGKGGVGCRSQTKFQ